MSNVSRRASNIAVFIVSGCDGIMSKNGVYISLVFGPGCCPVARGTSHHATVNEKSSSLAFDEDATILARNASDGTTLLAYSWVIFVFLLPVKRLTLTSPSDNVSAFMSSHLKRFSEVASLSGVAPGIVQTG